MKNLLIVEDNLQMRELIKGIFKGSFYRIYECEDGAEALEAYKLYKPDWVSMDIVMKNVDGITATREILNSFPDAKVIIVTDYDDEKFRKEAKSAGARGYVLKEDLSVLERIFINDFSNNNKLNFQRC